MFIKPHNNKSIKKLAQPKNLVSFAGCESLDNTPLGIAFSPLDYFEFVDWTGRVIREDKRGAIPEQIRPILQQLDVHEKNWVGSVKHYGRRFTTVIGSVDKIKALGQRLGRQWLHGIGGGAR